MLSPSGIRLRWQAVTCLVVTLGVLLFTQYFDPAKKLDAYLKDLLLSQARSSASSDQFVLLTLDERSLNMAGVLDPNEVAESKALQLMEAGYPWSREVYALTAERLLQAGARIVIFDMLFPKPRNGDDAFAAVLRKYPRQIVIGSSFEISESGKGSMSQYTPPTTALAEAAADGVGFVNFPAGSGDVVRTMWPYATESTFAGLPPLADETAKPSLSTTAAAFLGKRIPLNLRPLRFAYSRWGFFKPVPLYEIFVDTLWKINYGSGARFKDTIVLVGATAQQLQDFHKTPLGRIPGPVVQLHALSALLRDAWIREGGTALATVIILLAGAGAFVLILSRRRPRWLVVGLIGGVLFWVAVCAGSLQLFSFLLPVSPPLIVWLVCGFAGLACDVSIEQSERRRLRSTLERYVSRDVVQEIVENPASYLNTLAGQRKDACVLFSDLQGFTSSSENLDPAELVAQLNEYFSEMVAVVFQHHGTFDKTIGDALMAVWGCMTTAGPEEDAKRALRAAFDMKKRLAQLNARRTAKGLAPWGCGIGVCHGELIFGNIGSHEKMDYTVIGDTVNLASRIEGLTRMYGCNSLINERMAALVDGEFGLLPVDCVRVKGRKQPVELFFPFAVEEKPRHEVWITGFSEAKALYQAGNFAAARERFDSLSREGLAPGIAASFRNRCDSLVSEGAPAGWDGIWKFVEK